MGVRKLLASILLLLIASHVLAQTTIKGARIWQAPDNTRIVFDLTAPVKHNIFTLESPNRLIIDIANVELATALTKLNLKNTPITQIRASPQDSKNLRLVFDLSGNVTAKAFTLPPNKPYGHRLVVDIFNEAPSTQVATPQATQPDTPETNAPTYKPTGKARDIIIAIDPGHGGEDPGAIGKGNHYEKTVVLQIAKELKRQIDQQKGFKAVLTRSTDYFIPLRKRPQIARKAGADLFISIHADAAPNASAYGASVFALSEKGASSETARWLANTENQSDLIGGAGSVALDNKDQVLAGVLLDLSMTAVLSSSLDVGQKVLDNLGTITPLHKKRVEQAGFMVLKSPDIPSILVETGFISNTNEARKLGTASHQRNLAKAITSGVTSFFYKTPPPGTYIEQLRKQGKSNVSATTHKVSRGETLSGLAKNYGVNINLLKLENNLKSDNIHIGQVLKIPAR